MHLRLVDYAQLETQQLDRISIHSSPCRLFTACVADKTTIYYGSKKHCEIKSQPLLAWTKDSMYIITCSNILELYSIHGKLVASLPLQHHADPAHILTLPNYVIAIIYFDSVISLVQFNGTELSKIANLSINNVYARVTGAISTNDKITLVGFDKRKNESITVWKYVGLHPFLMSDTGITPKIYTPSIHDHAYQYFSAFFGHNIPAQKLSVHVNPENTMILTCNENKTLSIFKTGILN